MAQAFNYADGLRWFGEGVRALRNRPLGLVGIVVFYVLISGLLSGLPVVGTILAGVWMPFGAVLTGFAAREALADRLPGYAPLLAAFRKQGMRLHLIAWASSAPACLSSSCSSSSCFPPTRSRSGRWSRGRSTPKASRHTSRPQALRRRLSSTLRSSWRRSSRRFSLRTPGQGAGKSFFYSFFGILRNFSACLTTAVLLVLMTSAAVFLTVGAGLAAGLGGATTYITPIIAILVTTDRSGLRLADVPRPLRSEKPLRASRLSPPELIGRPCRHHQGRPRHRGLLHILTPRAPQKARAVRRPSARAIPRQAPAA